MASPGTALDGKTMLRVLQGIAEPVPPLWMMRQAGRYLPEYRAIRATVPTFLDFCYNPTLAAEATLQPIRRFGFDAAILFSDILVVPDALGQTVSFETGEGPRLDPIETPEQVSKLSEIIDLGRLEAVFETIGRVKSALPRETTFLGFCGAPWTVASYMIAGRGTPDQAPARLFAYRHPEAFQQIIDKLVDASVAYLVRQVDAGVDAVQIFDSWSGVLPRLEFDRWCLDPVQRIVSGLRAIHPDVPVIAFPRCAATHLERVAERLDVNAIGLDTAVDMEWAARRIQPLRAIQGNLDPLALIAGGAALEQGVRHVLHAAASGPFIFNLGHGIQPETPVAHVEQLVKLVRQGL